MADCSSDCGGGNRGGDQGGLLIGLMAGTLLGAAGLGLWLMGQAEQRRRGVNGRGAAARTTRHRLHPEPEDGDELETGPEPGEGELHDTVQRLNHAIEDVRRQLETLGTNGTADR